MDERFTPKKKGDPLSAKDDWNPLIQVTGRYAQQRPGSYGNLYHGPTAVSGWGPLPFNEFIVEVSRTINDDADSESSESSASAESQDSLDWDPSDGMYWVKIRYYNHVDELWKSDAKEWRLDAKAGHDILNVSNGGAEGIYVGRKIQAFWDNQRGTFVCGPLQLEIRNFELKEALGQFTDDEVDAYPRYWNPSLNGGWGRLVTQCSDNLIFKVADKNEEGHTAGVGGTGKCHMYQSDNGPIGVIFDLCCPGDEQGTCGGDDDSSSS